ncbi:MAG: DNA polymerase III subunit beta [Candidatus Staskawiczbacteria bacterium RIFOXYB2_FULL_32_9]|uniref:Beta sliding clamp n=1 Tax=Candidatus Staskawiczbacteria bacterium RIFOXYD1_FULL_32_13 TaxID=1802234 RepID=A0A1G2JN47_9BACT|nr:MAG: polymerase III subunit beta protein [Parcubacteria group bacterium GW2011_GWC2_32_10]OGZ78950.1 MAG: DNA polymerase III subunit beta [Candidatus Staskawiczbacteria bacterium RIFOXYB1_FULL_32_11]OGZ83176.1 MAG: DNA polymerase III subunit beta [Candidatus Staskawiczbacteria bacterium RIFOXYB2_FULL_32_9]OGZ85794.1 MAG: DNA polymerase III subunit beta [Candidatus Staskawiczbacteria bacterium RIFOXYC2_FULL_32_10]OGZ88577.1 MAG: DNA polymerase III subunit beta [Candidatus Staskawiczbacteria b
MKIEILKENLKMALNVVERIVGKNLSLPILDNVLIDTDENYLVLSSTDLETAIKLWILTKIVKKGKVAIPVKFLSSFISLLPNEKITLEEKKQGLYIECKNFKTQIQGSNPEEFPIIPEFKNLEFVDLDIKKVCQGLSQVVDIASVSQSRPEISGIYFLFSKNNLKIVATDSFRLAEKTIVLDKAVKKEISFIIPQKPAKEIMNILIEKDENAKIYFSPNQIMFEVQMKESEKPQIQITSRLIEGEYPNYQDIIPKDFKTKIVLKRDEFLNQIKTASLFSGKINEVKFIVNSKNNEVEIFAQSADIGENRSSLSAKIQGEDLEVSFNHKYLIDGLNNIKSSEVIFELSEKEGPCVLKPVGDVNYLYVVMPIKST